MSKFAGKPFRIIGVNSDKDLAKLKPRLETEKITWRSFWNGPQGTNGGIAEQWNVYGWPTIYVIDHLGVIRHKNLREEEKLDAALAALIEAAEAAPKKADR